MHTPIGPDNTIFDVWRTPFREKLGMPPQNILAVGGMDGLSVILEWLPLAAIGAEKNPQILFRIEDLTCQEILFPTASVTQRFRLTQNPLALSNCLLRAPGLSDITRIEHDRPDAGFIQKIVANAVGPAPGSILMLHTILHVDDTPGHLDQLGEPGEYLPSIIRMHELNAIFSQEFVSTIAP